MRDAVLLRHAAELFHQAVVADHAAVLHHDGGAVAVLGDALALRDAGRVARQVHVEAHADVRAHLVGRGGGAAQAHLFLRAEGHHDVGGVLLAGALDAAQRLDGHEAGHAVVERLAHHLERRLHERLVEHHVVAHLDLLLDVGRGHAQVDEELLDARHLGALGIARDVDGLAARVHDAVDVATVGDHGHAARKQVAGIEAAGGVHPEVAMVVHVAHVEADLVHVRGQEHGGGLAALAALSLGCLARADERAHVVHVGRIEHAAAGLAEDGLLDEGADALLASRDAGGLAEATEEVEVELHGVFPCVGPRKAERKS